MFQCDTKIFKAVTSDPTKRERGAGRAGRGWFRGEGLMDVSDDLTHTRCA